jgi:hypothetical protein
MPSNGKDPAPAKGEGGGRGNHLGWRGRCGPGREILHWVKDDKLTQDGKLTLAERSA